ncbi:hypothetical protein D917_03088 [Trichinella nativa]|uniref:Uncharacterized protein n=1 Tax=Trichinella nativa TaxID=6335 RepID=A0A1Y3EBC0_9BILA|nr:hypothetical protein D917_03088 [Trichinella nativa]
MLQRSTSTICLRLTHPYLSDSAKDSLKNDESNVNHISSNYCKMNTSAQLKLSIQLLHCGHCSSLGNFKINSKSDTCRTRFNKKTLKY